MKVSVTVITGAGGGMGLACVERFSESRLLLVDIDDRRARKGSGRSLPEAKIGGGRPWLPGVDRRARASDRRVRRLRQTDSPRWSMPDDGRRRADPPSRPRWNGGPARRSARDSRGAGSVVICIASIAAYLISVSPDVEAVLDEPQCTGASPPDWSWHSDLRSNPGRHMRWRNTE